MRNISQMSYMKLFFLLLLFNFFIEEKAYAVVWTFRLGMTGVIYDRAPEEELGGGQLALDVKPFKNPLAFNLSWEDYKKDPVADSTYEISSFIVFHTLFMKELRKDLLMGYVGGGAGLMRVPEDSDPATNSTISAIAGSGVAGLNLKVAGVAGIYLEGKYIRVIRGKNYIDLNNFGFAGGISINFW
jgi:hypothetical protein